MPSKAKKSGPDGDVLGDAARLAGQAALIVRLGVKWAQHVGGENHLRSLSLYPPTRERNGMWLVVAKGWSGGYKVVAFHRASDPVTALAGALSRIYDQSIAWKPDSYADRE